MADVGLLAILAIVAVMVAAWVLRRQLRSDAKAAGAALNRLEAQAIAEMVIDVGRRLGGDRNLIDLFPPEHDVVLWGKNRFPGRPVMDQLEWAGEPVKEAGLEIYRLLQQVERSWYCHRSPLLASEAIPSLRRDRERFVLAWTKSREYGMKPYAEMVYLAGRSFKTWEGALPWTRPPYINLVRWKIDGYKNLISSVFGPSREQRQMELHARRTESSLRDFGLEAIADDLDWPQIGDGRIDKHVKEASAFDDLSFDGPNLFSAG